MILIEKFWENAAIMWQNKVREWSRHGKNSTCSVKKIKCCNTACKCPPPSKCFDMFSSLVTVPPLAVPCWCEGSIKWFHNYSILSKYMEIYSTLRGAQGMFAMAFQFDIMVNGRLNWLIILVFFFWCNYINIHNAQKFMVSSSVSHPIW